MGRKLDISALSSDEEKRILDVIQRDSALRQVEQSRIGRLSKDYETEEAKQKEIVKEIIDEELPVDKICTKCGSKFLWLFNTKMNCANCELYFCKSKPSCIRYDSFSEKWLCAACLKQKSLQYSMNDWFYGKVKGKFRRHGGAKVKREIYKRKKQGQTANGAPAKPPRVGLSSDGSFSLNSSVASTPPSFRKFNSESKTNGIAAENSKNDSPMITQAYDIDTDSIVVNSSPEFETAPHVVTSNSIEIQTDHDLEMEDPTLKQLSTIKEELEQAIVKLLMPILEEIKSNKQQQSDEERQKKIEEAQKLAEEMIDISLQKAKDQQEHISGNVEENILLTNYFTDSREELMRKISLQLYDENASHNGSINSTRSSLRETGTMTETSDSELESVSSYSGRGRNKSVPLSERLSSLSPDSLRRTLNSSADSSRNGSITQGVVLKKDQLVARADMDNALFQLLDEQGVKVHDPNEPQEFSTELKFTAVGGTNSRARRSSFDENSDTSDDEIARLKPVLKTDSNWLTPDAERKPERFGNGVKNRNASSLMSFNDKPTSPYDQEEETDSDSDREHVEEEEVRAKVIKRSNDGISSLSLMSRPSEIVDSSSVTLNNKHQPLDVSIDSVIVERLSEDIDRNAVKIKKDKKSSEEPIGEEVIEAVNRKADELNEFPDLDKQEQIDPTIRKRDDHSSSGVGIYFANSESDSDLSAIIEDDQEDGGNDTSSLGSRSDSENELSEKENKTRSNIKSAVFIHSNRDSLDRSENSSIMNDKIKVPDAMSRQMNFEPGQQEVSVDMNDIVSISSVSDGDTYATDQSLTPTRELSPRESALAMRMITDKSISILSDAMHQIDDRRDLSSESDSGSTGDSSKTFSQTSTPSAIENDELNQAVEDIYINSATTFALQDRVDLLDRDVTRLNSSELDPARLRRLEAQVAFVEKQTSDVELQGNSIAARMKQLRTAGLKAEQGNFKRHSLGDTNKRTSKWDEPRQRSLDLSQQIPVNTRPLSMDEDSLRRNTIIVVPGSKIPIIKADSIEKESIIPVRKPRSVSSNSSTSIRDDSPLARKNFAVPAIRKSVSSSTSSRSSMISMDGSENDGYVPGMSIEIENLSSKPVASPRISPRSHEKKRQNNQDVKTSTPIVKPRTRLDKSPARDVTPRKREDSTSESESERSVSGSKKNMFATLSASEQREMARIALAHLPETAIVNKTGKRETKTAPIVDKSEDILTNTPKIEVDVTPVQTQKTESSKKPSLVQEQKEKLMAKMKGGEELYKMYKYDKKVEPDVNENDSKGTSFNTDTERMKQTSKKSLDVEELSDLDRSAAFRGSITMRGGKKMVLTTSPQQGNGFQVVVKRNSAGKPLFPKVPKVKKDILQ